MNLLVFEKLAMIRGNVEGISNCLAVAEEDKLYDAMMCLRAELSELRELLEKEA